MADRDRPESESHGDPAAAFDALRAEVARLGEAIEALQTELIESRGPDLTPTLAQIAKAQQLVAQQLARIDKHPAITMTPEQHQQTIVNAGAALVDTAVRRTQEASRAMEGEVKQLQGLIGTARTKQRQLEVLAIGGGAAILGGILLAPFVVRGMPFGLDESIAAFILHADQWNAGARLMAAANPDAWRELQGGEELMRANRGTLTACRDAAAKTKKVQRCMISVSAQK